MAPAVGIKRGSAASQAVVALPPTDARLAVRDVMRSTIPAPSPAEAPAAVAGFLCLEEVDGRRWSYVVDGGAAAGKGKGRGVSTGSPSVRAVPMQSPLPPAEVSARSTPRFGAGHGLEGLIAGVGNYLHHFGRFHGCLFGRDPRMCAREFGIPLASPGGYRFLGVVVNDAAEQIHVFSTFIGSARSDS
jgi:hypothetical protein